MQMNDPTKEALRQLIDENIRKLYLYFFKLSDVQKENDFTEEDLDLWVKLTSHSAVQSKLEEKFKMEMKNEDWAKSSNH
jgi:hypothetical protein